MNPLEILARRLCDAVEQGNDNTDQELNALLDFLRDQDNLRSDHEGTIAAAKANYADDDCEVGKRPMVVPADGGVWVEAWVWVSTKED